MVLFVISPLPIAINPNKFRAESFAQTLPLESSRPQIWCWSSPSPCCLKGEEWVFLDLLFLESGWKWPICFDIFDGLLLENGDFPYYSYVSLLQGLLESCGWKWSQSRLENYRPGTSRHSLVHHLHIDLHYCSKVGKPMSCLPPPPSHHHRGGINKPFPVMGGKTM